MINSSLLLSQMKLRNVSTKAFADAQGWSISTTYRKINGRTEFTQSEIQTTIALLSLDTAMANEIFFALGMSYKTNSGGVLYGN